jgi:hypothetical protein
MDMRKHFVACAGDMTYDLKRNSNGWHWTVFRNFGVYCEGHANTRDEAETEIVVATGLTAERWADITPQPIEP